MNEVTYLSSITELRTSIAKVKTIVLVVAVMDKEVNIQIDTDTAYKYCDALERLVPPLEGDFGLFAEEDSIVIMGGPYRGVMLPVLS